MSAAAGSDWRESALCAQTDPELWFPEKGRGAAAARAICTSCEVREPCMEWAVAHGESGIWGSTDPGQRREIRRTRDPRPQSGGRQPSPCGTRAAYLRHLRRGEDVDEACQEANNAANAKRREEQREARRQRRQNAA